MLVLIYRLLLLIDCRNTHKKMQSTATRSGTAPASADVPASATQKLDDLISL